MEQIKNFVIRHFKTIAVIASFLLTMYIQHMNNIRQLGELTGKCAMLEGKIQDQYDRIDAIKLDKAVFEATMMQFNSVRNDLHELRADIRELLKSKHMK